MLSIIYVYDSWYNSEYFLLILGLLSHTDSQDSECVGLIWVDCWRSINSCNCLDTLSSFNIWV